MKRFRLFIQKNSQQLWLITVISISILFQLVKVGYGITNGIFIESSLDFSWTSDIVERLLHGYIAGQDFIFTYGPLYQLIASIPSLLFGIPSFIGILYLPLILSTVVLFLVFLICKFVTKERQLQNFLFLFLSIVVGVVFFPDFNNLFRGIAPLVFALAYYVYLAPSNMLLNTYSSSYKKLLSYFLLFLPIVLGMYSFDLFILCIAISILILCYDWYVTRFLLRKYLSTALLHFILIALSAILASFLLSGNLDYLRFSFTTVKDYQFIENIPWDFNRSSILLLIPLLLGVLSWYILKVKDQRWNKSALVVMILTSILSLKSAFIRSDEGHLILGIYPSLITACIIIFFLFSNKKLQTLAVIVGILVVMLIPQKDTMYHYLSMQYLRAAFSPFTKSYTFFDIYTFPQSYYFSAKDFSYLNSFIKKTPESIMIYPYDTYLLNIFEKTYNTLPLQWYDYSNSSVEKEAVVRLKESPPKYIILGVDNKGAIALDDIPNFSRNPIFTKWMFANYSVLERKEKILILQHTPNKESASAQHRSCSIYEIDVRHIMKSSLFENLTKPASYYMISPKSFRLPYISHTERILIVENYDKSKFVAQLFENQINFENPYPQKKDMHIEKKLPIPFFKSTFSAPFVVTCFN